jgi:phage shock protein E
MRTASPTAWCGCSTAWVERVAAGHLTGAVNIPVELPDFGARIAQLDPKGSYIVYCRTGRRSAIAVDQMKSVGFTDLLDLGAIEKAADATGLTIVQG